MGMLRASDRRPAEQRCSPLRHRVDRPTKSISVIAYLKARIIGRARLREVSAYHITMTNLMHARTTNSRQREVGKGLLGAG